MRLTERDRLVLSRSFIMLLWLGLICWALFYSFWLGLAVSLYINLERTLFHKYWKP